VTAALPNAGRRARDIVVLVPKIVLTALLLLAIGDMIVGVILRYVVTAITDWLEIDPVNFFWVEEVGELALAWLTMIGAAIAIAERAHFTLHLVTHRFPPGFQRAIHVVFHLMIAGFGALACWQGIRLARSNGMLTSPALELSLAWLYAAAAVGGALIVLYGLFAAFEVPSTEENALQEPGVAAAGED
jgi:TRAP-type C4-dicarboxylate transport system permease small subunit